MAEDIRQSFISKLKYLGILVSDKKRFFKVFENFPPSLCHGNQTSSQKKFCKDFERGLPVWEITVNLAVSCDVCDGVFFVLSFFPRGVLDEILNLIKSVSEGFPTYSNLMFISANLVRFHYGRRRTETDH